MAQLVRRWWWQRSMHVEVPYRGEGSSPEGQVSMDYVAKFSAAELGSTLFVAWNEVEDMGDPTHEMAVQLFRDVSPDVNLIHFFDAVRNQTWKFSREINVQVSAA